MWETTKSFFKTIKEAHKVGKDNPKSIRILFPLLKKRKGSKMKYLIHFEKIRQTLNFTRESIRFQSLLLKVALKSSKIL